MQERTEARRGVEAQALTGSNERNCEPAEYSQQYPHGSSVEQGAVIKSTRAVHRAGMPLISRDDYGRDENR